MSNINAENYIDEDYQELGVVEEESNLITKINTPINILLLGLIFIVLAAILILIFCF